MLWRRLLGAALVIPPVLLLFWCEDQFRPGWPGLFLVPLALLVGVAAATEMVAWLTQRAMPVIAWLAIGGVPIVILVTRIAALGTPHILHGLVGSLFGITLVLALGFLHGMRSYQVPDRWFSRLGHTLLIVGYLGIPLSCLVLLRVIAPDRRGLLGLFSVLLIVKFSDVGAYFIGRWLGRRPLAPQLSPRKTWEGAVGGLLFGMLAAAFCLRVLGPRVLPSAPPTGWLAVFGYGAAVTLAGMCGDLAESLLKRDLQLKDAASWMPGLGGAMDVLDSLLFAAPIGLLWWHLGWV